MTTKLHPVSAQQIVDAYQAGKSTTEIAALTGLSPAAVNWRIKKEGVKLRSISEGVRNFWKSREPTPKIVVPCCIEGCNRPVYGRGWCSPHWQMWRRHGDPLAGKQLPWSREEVAAYLNDVVLLYAGCDCLLWPYGRNRARRHPYPTIGPRYVHRIVCAAAHGPAPSRRHQAAHSCGNSLCVARAHLSWKTPGENAADKEIHGTSLNGEKNPQAKLTRGDVLSIRAASGEQTHKEIAQQFGVSRQTIGRVIAGTLWGSI